MTDTDRRTARCQPSCPTCALLEAMDRRPWVCRVVDDIGDAVAGGLALLFGAGHD